MKPWQPLGKKTNQFFFQLDIPVVTGGTVMEGEAFSDSTIAEYLNAQFLPIKVDREERPDIDSIYMQALQMMIGQGGWPLNVFLTPRF